MRVQPNPSAVNLVAPTQAKKLKYRLAEACGGQIQGQQDRHFPPANKLDYNNYLVAVKEIHYCEY